MNANHPADVSAIDTIVRAAGAAPCGWCASGRHADCDGYAHRETEQDCSCHDAGHPRPVTARHPEHTRIDGGRVVCCVDATDVDCGPAPDGVDPRDVDWYAGELREGRLVLTDVRRGAGQPLDGDGNRQRYEIDLGPMPALVAVLGRGVPS